MLMSAVYGVVLYCINVAERVAHKVLLRVIVACYWSLLFGFDEYGGRVGHDRVIE